MVTLKLPNLTFHNSRRRYMAGILPIRRKTQDNQSINQSINQSNQQNYGRHRSLLAAFLDNKFTSLQRHGPEKNEKVTICM